jgi:hypothetical protein
VKALHTLTVQIGIDGKAEAPGPVAVHVLAPDEPEVTRYPERHEMEQPESPVTWFEHPAE